MTCGTNLYLTQIQIKCYPSLISFALLKNASFHKERS